MITKGDSSAGSMKYLVETLNVPREEVFDALYNQKVEIVLTAHPTEVNRRTMLEKHNRLRNALDALDDPGRAPYELRQLYKQVHTNF